MAGMENLHPGHSSFSRTCRSKPIQIKTELRIHGEIMLANPPFPEPYLVDPMRQAELRVYQELVRSPAPGQALYQVNAFPNAPELDALAALEGVAYVCAGIKGGFYKLTNDGKWFLRTDFGWQKTPCPLKQTWLAAISVHDALLDSLNLNIFVVAVLILPDMDRDPAIERATANDKVRIIWGTDDLVNRMAEIARTRTICTPPTAGQIARVVEFFMPGLGTAPEPHPTPAATEIAGRQLIIQHVDTMNVYPAGWESEGR